MVQEVHQLAEVLSLAAPADAALPMVPPPNQESMQVLAPIG